MVVLLDLVIEDKGVCTDHEDAVLVKLYLVLDDSGLIGEADLDSGSGVLFDLVAKKDELRLNGCDGLMSSTSQEEVVHRSQGNVSQRVRFKQSCIYSREQHSRDP